MPVLLRGADGDGAAGLSVLDSVFHQVQQQLGHQALVGGQPDLLRHLFGQADFICRRLLRQFGQHVRHHIPEGDFLALQAVFPLIPPGQGQQLGDDAVHPPALQQNGGRLLLRLPIRRVGGQVFRVGHDDGDRGAELMGGVRGELLLPLKGLLQAGQHPVEGPRQPPHLVPALDARDAPGQIPGPQGYRRLRDVVDGPQGQLCQEVAAEDCQSQKGGDSQQHHQLELLQRPLHRPIGTADPDAERFTPLQLQFLIQIELISSHAGRQIDLVRLKGGRVRPGALTGHHPAAGARGEQVLGVGRQIQIVQEPQLTVLPLDMGGQLARRRAEVRLLIPPQGARHGAVQNRQGYGQQNRGQQGIPEHDFDPDGNPTHRRTS